MRHLRALGALVAWTAAIVLGLMVLASLGRSTFPNPPTGDLDELVRWATTTSPPVAAGSLVRLMATGMGWYLLATTLAGVLGRLLGLRRTVHLLDHVSLPVVRRLAGRVVGVGLVAQLSLLTGAGAATTVPSVPEAQPTSPAADRAHEMATMATLPPSTTTMRAIPEPDPDPAPTSTTMRAIPEPDPDPAPSTTTMRAIPEPDPDPAPSTTTMSAIPESDESAADPPATAVLRALPDGAEAHATPPTAPATWTVRPGDHLWRIAEVLVGLDQGSRPSDAAVEVYLERLIEVNRSRLPHPDDPDLILPGLDLVLPPLGGAGHG